MPIPAKIAKAVRAAAQDRCQACRFAERSGRPGVRGTVLELHHLEPQAHGGKSTAENLVLLCPTCHRIAQDLADDGSFARADQLRFVRKIRRPAAKPKTHSGITLQRDHTLADILSQRSGCAQNVCK
jgi:predicted restriction endonuclease